MGTPTTRLAPAAIRHSGTNSKATGLVGLCTSKTPDGSIEWYVSLPVRRGELREGDLRSRRGWSQWQALCPPPRARKPDPAQVEPQGLRQSEDS